MMILDACGFHSVIGIKVLVQKALISIWNGRFDMHDLVQEMAHYIVRGEHPKNPEKHSRVWKKEDVLKICAMDATTGTLRRLPHLYTTRASKNVKQMREYTRIQSEIEKEEGEAATMELCWRRTVADPSDDFRSSLSRCR
ncbi:unnamed protein product [Lactuca virosa]|uniref:Disease resistance protein Roq1-like winged-helix domain-containing protein n=1 Tax=Lactuca virosa TaxID=75947 RepID=A0AAU9MXE5_9ASTR|nr:unnamed protein product [Lactuca virosa]